MLIILIRILLLEVCNCNNNVPAISEKAKHVTMIQRSPTYVVSGPSEDKINKFLRKFLPTRLHIF